MEWNLLVRKQCADGSKLWHTGKIWQSDYKPCLIAKQVSWACVKADKELAYPES